MARAAFSLGAVLLVAFAVPGQPQAPEPRPVPGVVRWTEDYGFLRDPGKRTDWFDPVKFVPLNRNGSVYATFGAEYRVEHEWFRNPDWGSGEESPRGYVLQRFMPYADLHFGRRVRLFTTLKMNYVNGRVGGPRPVDEDKGDVHEAFLDVRVAESESQSVTLRMGRQELSYGQGLLINNREGTNVRQSFDAATVVWRTTRWRVDSFAARPAETNREWFDDSPDHRQTLWGVYATYRKRLDLFYIGTDLKRRRWQSGTGRDLRHTIGARLSGQYKGWAYDYEGAWQAGRFRETLPIAAWAVATETGYRFAKARWQPHLALRLDTSSGDRSATDGHLGNFLVPYPKGSYWGRVLLNGPFNFSDLHPLLELQFSRRWEGQLHWVWFWRTSRQDGVYGIAGQLLRAGGPNQDRFIGQQGTVEVRWHPDRHTTFAVGFSSFLAGRFLKQAPPGRDVLFVNTGVTYRF